MRIAILLFGPAKDIVGSDQVIVEVPDGARIETVRRELASNFPRIAPALSSMRLAVNQSFVSDDQAVRAGDEVAIIPPVSGG